MGTKTASAPGRIHTRMYREKRIPKHGDENVLDIINRTVNIVR